MSTVRSPTSLVVAIVTMTAASRIRGFLSIFLFYSVGNVDWLRSTELRVQNHCLEPRNDASVCWLHVLCKPARHCARCYRSIEKSTSHSLAFSQEQSRWQTFQSIPFLGGQEQSSQSQTRRTVKLANRAKLPSITPHARSKEALVPQNSPPASPIAMKDCLNDCLSAAWEDASTHDNTY